MTDALSEIAKSTRETGKLIKEGKILKCIICWNTLKNDKAIIKDHLLNHHTINEVVDDFASISFDLWNSKYKTVFERLYKVK